jgi:predicted RNA-binding protein YlxR (DUF448 family)
MAEPEAGSEPDAEAGAGDGPGPLRRCLVTRAVQPKEAMIRFVLGPDGTVVPDLAGRLPGRGMWLSAKAAVLEEARARRLFARAAKAEARVPDGLCAIIVAGLERRVAETLGLARRAGQAVCGFVKAREWVVAGRAGLVVTAQDGAADGLRKLLAGSGVVAVAPLGAAALGAVFGREQCVHVALAPGRLAAMVAVDAARLAGMRGSTVGGAGDGTDDRDGTG